MSMYWVEKYSSMPSRPPSRPRPDCLTPPNGPAALRDDAGVQAEHAGLEAFAHQDAAVQVAGDDDQAVFGVVGQPDGVVLRGEGDDRPDGSEEDFLGQDPGALGDAGEDGGPGAVSEFGLPGGSSHRRGASTS
jgi:hypothetical protein